MGAKFPFGVRVEIRKGGKCKDRRKGGKKKERRKVKRMEGGREGRKEVGNRGGFNGKKMKRGSEDERVDQRVERELEETEG